ncbi:adenosine deaminase [Gorillibacterium massiliense]|uniref:adenosine deaminase n=1 Tax=Gorillibacterium massiliense TaxID=1280390 RepID=UPI0004AC714B|nr:adenosine deaminase [Gorillibacterium massiliense]
MQVESRDDLIFKMPKVELHMHLDGSIKPETVLDLARITSIPLPVYERERLISYLRVDDHCGSLREYLNKFDFILPFLQSASALERTAYEAVEQTAEQNGRYVEVRFAPHLHTKMGLTLEEAIGSVVEGLKRGEQQFAVKAGAIVICMRHHSPELNRSVVEAAALFAGKGVAAVDLAGDEAAFPPEMFRNIFALAHKKGLPVTIHAGEAGGAGNVYEAVKHLGATRVGHGVRLKEDSAIFDYIQKRQVPLEMCPTSNIQTKAVPGWRVYPLREYFDRGLKVTVNTDNPSVSGTDLAREYRILAEQFKFSSKELAAIVLNGADAAFLGETEKAQLKRQIKAELSDLGIVV